MRSMRFPNPIIGAPPIRALASIAMKAKSPGPSISDNISQRTRRARTRNDEDAARARPSGGRAMAQASHEGPNVRAPDRERRSGSPTESAAGSSASNRRSRSAQGGKRAAGRHRSGRHSMPSSSGRPVARRAPGEPVRAAVNPRDCGETEGHHGDSISRLAQAVDNARLRLISPSVRHLGAAIREQDHQGIGDERRQDLGV